MPFVSQYMARLSYLKPFDQEFGQCLTDAAVVACVLRAVDLVLQPNLQAWQVRRRIRLVYNPSLWSLHPVGFAHSRHTWSTTELCSHFPSHSLERIVE